MPLLKNTLITAATLAAALLLASCKGDRTPPQTSPSVGTIHPDRFQSPGTPLPRAGDEIMVAGQLFHTGAPVVLWTDPGGYDAYRTERRFANFEDAS